MSDVASGGSEKKKKINEEGVSNEEHNKNKNSRNPKRIHNQYNTVKFKGKVEGMLTLGVKDFCDFFCK